MKDEMADLLSCWLARAGAGGAPGKGRLDGSATVESPRGNQRGRQPAQRDGDRATAGTAQQVRDATCVACWLRCPGSPAATGLTAWRHAVRVPIIRTRIGTLIAKVGVVPFVKRQLGLAVSPNRLAGAVTVRLRNPPTMMRGSWRLRG
jgi:hypothetical protein